MALQTVALLVLAQAYAGDIVRQQNRRSVALALLPKTAGAGKNVAWAAQGSGAVAEAYAEGADASNFASDSQSSAILPWSFYRSNFQVSTFAKSAARTSQTPEGNIELYARDILDGSAALADKLNKAIYIGASGQTPGQIVGFDEAIGLDNNTYATIDRSTSAFWRPYVIANSGTAQALSFAQIRKDLAAIMTAGGEKPNIAFVGPQTFVAVAALFDPQKQYQYITTFPGAGGAIELEGGTGMIKFDGCYFVEDKDATEGKIYYANTSAVHVEYLPIDDNSMGSADEGMDADMTDGMEAIPLGMRIKALAATGDSDKAMMFVYPQLVVRRPNMCGVRKDVAYT